MAILAAGVAAGFYYGGWVGAGIALAAVFALAIGISGTVVVGGFLIAVWIHRSSVKRLESTPMEKSDDRATQKTV